MGREFQTCCQPAWELNGAKPVPRRLGIRAAHDRGLQPDWFLEISQRSVSEAMIPQIIVIFSVDWEPDHGKWRPTGSNDSYGGILKGTPALEEILDDLEIPCTWFVETSQEPERNTPRLFPEIVSRIAGRTRDEVGLHLHWRRHRRGNEIVYETEDPAWVLAQLKHGRQELSRCGIRPESFRGGSFLYVLSLAESLAQASFHNDSTLLWSRCHRLDSTRSSLRRNPSWKRAAVKMHQYFGTLPRPYFADHDDVERSGSSAILEFPVLYNILDLPRPQHALLHQSVLRRAARRAGPAFLTLFMHIDELTQSRPGSGAPGVIDSDMTSHLRASLEALKARKDLAFVTVREARKLLQGSTAL